MKGKGTRNWPLTSFGQDSFRFGWWPIGGEGHQNMLKVDGFAKILWNLLGFGWIRLNLIKYGRDLARFGWISPKQSLVLPNLDEFLIYHWSGQVAQVLEKEICHSTYWNQFLEADARCKVMRALIWVGIGLVLGGLFGFLGGGRV